MTFNGLKNIRYSLFFIYGQSLLSILVVISAFLYPGSLGPTRLENFLLPLFIFILAFKKLTFDRTIVIILVINMIIGLISVLVNLNYNYGFLELLRWVKYILIIALFSSFSPDERKKIPSYIRLAFWGMALVNLIQIFNPMNFGVELANVYSHHTLYNRGEEVVDNAFRLLGTAINPNNNAILWLLMSVYFMVEYYERRKYGSIIYVFISFMFIIFTQSRTAIVVLMFIGLSNLFLYKLKWRHFIFLGIMAVAGLFVAIWFRFTYLWHIFLFNPLKIHSLQLRFAIWRDMLQLYYQKPVIGWGNLKNYETLYPKPPDNEFLYILLNQGAAGIFGFVLIVIYTIHFFMNKRKEFAYSYLPVFITICFLIIGMTNLALTNIRIGMFFFMIWGLSYSYRKNT